MRRLTRPVGTQFLAEPALASRDLLGALTEQLGDAFPHGCVCCGRTYHTLRDYLEHALPEGVPLRVDLAHDLVGALTRATCTCGATLALDPGTVDEGLHRRCLDEIHEDCDALRVHPAALLEALRQRLRSSILRPR
jgi:hypothetical protein